MKEKAWSFSQLNNFETCPKKYWHLSIEKDYKEEEGEAIQYGKKVHKALELLVRDGTPLPQELAHMHDYVAPFIGIDATRLCEQQLAITKEFLPCDWKDWDNAWCRAVIDLAIMGEESAVLIDYKTGRMKDDGFTQLKLAAAVFMLHYPKVQRVQAAYLWTEHDGKMTKDVFTRAQMQELWNELFPRLTRFQQAFATSEYPAKPSGLCRRFCPITGCPHHGA